MRALHVRVIEASAAQSGLPQWDPAITGRFCCHKGIKGGCSEALAAPSLEQPERQQNRRALKRRRERMNDDGHDRCSA